ncbi:Hypothetical predicted protein [Podarcis lilfordi]|uniref:Uncharacterized protein n=1 Tax=Podarcis lilfordi TaxID=74358 RepID=A0AA35KW00_9SAUR|nr:Hypothetical predicted protein [Podarcis lilfordi]
MLNRIMKKRALEHSRLAKEWKSKSCVSHFQRLCLHFKSRKWHHLLDDNESFVPLFGKSQSLYFSSPISRLQGG